MDRMSYAAKWRWAKTICKGKCKCKIKKKHVRGYKDCCKNPDKDEFGFDKPMGEN